METVETLKLVINGALVNSFDHFIIRNPATGKAIAHAPQVTRSQIDFAVHCAVNALPGWASCDDKNGIFMKAAHAIEQQKDALANLLTAEQGKPLCDAMDEINAAISCFKNAAELRVTEKIISETSDHTVKIRHLPIGVVGAILPWNYPLFLCADKIARATAFGNCIVVKPSPHTPATSLRLGSILCDIFPPGVVNVVSGTDSSISENPGSWLVRNPSVAKICFVGSTATGKNILHGSVDDMKRTSLEMGGNDAAIVLEDADVAETVDGVLNAALCNNGQICVAIKRVYVARSIFDDFVITLVEAAKAKSRQVGNGVDPGVTLGPVNNRQQWGKLQLFLEDAIKNGGTVLCGGGPPSHLEQSDGDLFLAPTVVVGMDEKCLLVQDEQFGPIIPVIPYDMVEEAVFKANDSIYGLGASVWGSDVNQANQVASKLRAGMVWVKEHGSSLGKAPCGGFRQSGLGREGDWGDADLSSFTETQVIKLAK